ncbi:MAG: hypothetical protein ACE5G2_04230 [Candidatus Krumholzibacteriia bacterium]
MSASRQARPVGRIRRQRAAFILTLLVVIPALWAARVATAGATGLDPQDLRALERLGGPLPPVEPLETSDEDWVGFDAPRSRSRSHLGKSVLPPPRITPDDGFWSDEFGNPLPVAGTNGTVWSLLEYDGGLIAGGDFTMAGGVVAYNIARWDGTSWSPLGTGMNDAVFTLAVHEGDLIAGGWFTWAGGGFAAYIARWDGSSWSPLGSGLNGRVRALLVHDEKLIVGGDFSTAGGMPADEIAGWDGASWSPLGAGFAGGYADLGVVP